VLHCYFSFEVASVFNAETNKPESTFVLYEVLEPDFTAKSLRMNVRFSNRLSLTGGGDKSDREWWI